MSDDIDRELTALFAQASQPLPSEEFVSSLTKRVTAVRRLRVVTLGSVAVVLLVLLAAAAPYAAHASIELARVMTGGTGTLGAMLTSPLGIGASLLLGLSVLAHLRARLR